MLSYRCISPWRRAFLAAFVLFFALTHGQAALAQSAEEPYRLNIGDVVAVSVFGRAELSGDFPVSADGTIAFPLLGNVEAAGLTPSEFSVNLDRDLSQHVPGVSVTAAVSQYAPVIVVGEVERPGRYEYRPGMTALELVALGGGIRRGNAALENSRLQMIVARQDYTDLELQIFGHEAARARLQSVLKDVPFEEVPPINDPDPARREVKARIIDGERRLLEIDEANLATEEEALLAQERSYQNEVEKVTASIVLHKQEIELLLADVEAQRSLVERGLSAKSNLREVERTLSSTRRDALELDSFLARAQQNELAIRQRRQALAATRRSDAAKQLQEVELSLARMKIRQRALMDTMAELALSSSESVGESRPQPSFDILRRNDGRYAEIAAQEQSLLKPGDIVRVNLPEVTELRRAGLD